MRSLASGHFWRPNDDAMTHFGASSRQTDEKSVVSTAANGDDDKRGHLNGDGDDASERLVMSSEMSLIAICDFPKGKGDIENLKQRKFLLS